MAVKKPIIVYLLLLFLVQLSHTDVCKRKLCKCSKKSGKFRVICRSRNLTEVYQQDQFPEDMRILDLSRNNISIIRKGFLDNHYKLERLYLQKNAIKLLEERAFVGLDGLSRLNLRRNKLTNVNGKAFLGLTKLDTLDLSDNQIQSINKFAFVGLKSLSALNLKNNRFTVIANGTFDKLISLRKLNMMQVPLVCECKLNSFVAFLTKTDLRNVFGKCRGRKQTLSELKGTNLCEKPPDININPSSNQIVSVGDDFIITCFYQATATYKQNLDWSKSQNSLPRLVKESKLVKVEKSSSANRIMTYIKFHSVSSEDGGTYTCFGDKLIPKQIYIKVVTSENDVCSRDVMQVQYDHFLWPVTMKRENATVSCPWPNDKGTKTNVRRTCTEKGVWGKVKLGNCTLLSLSEKLIRWGQLLKNSDFDDVERTAEQLKLLTEASSYQTAENVSLAFNVFAGIIRKNKPMKGKLLDNMLQSFNNIMNINDETLYASERRDQSPSRLGARLELISRQILNETSSHVLSNIVIGSVKRFRSNISKTCHVFFDIEVWSQPGGVFCGANRRQNYSVAIKIPGTITQSLQAAGHSVDELKLQFLVYRNAKLFPFVISNRTQGIMRDKSVSSSVLSIQMGNIKELNLSDPMIIHFATQPGTEPIVSHFDFGEEVVGKQWSLNTDCVIKDSNTSTTTVECRRLVNKNLAIISHPGVTNVIVIVYPVEIVVYFGAVVTSLFLMATLLTFAFARKVRFNRDDIIMLMNVCLALLVVVLSFAFGIDQTESPIACRALGMSLHFFFFASLLWLGSYVECLTRRLLPRNKDPTEEIFNPVLMYYMVSWGVPAIICGMTIAGDIKNYKVTEFCWLTESAGLGAFVGPACLLFLINSVLLVRLHLLQARGITNQHPCDNNTEEQQLQSDEPGVLEEIPQPSGDQNPEKSTTTLYLVATWVAMSLIYLNFILAYFLVSSRTSKVRWILLSYVYALANIALGAAIFCFHCVARPEVRKAWECTWKQVRMVKVNCLRCRILSSCRKENRTQMNGRITVNRGDNAHRGESDRQSNITLPSSAALTNDVFVNGRPMSTARLSLLDEADFPHEESPRAGAAENEVDITEPGCSGDNRRSQNSVHSERRSGTQGDSILEVSPPIPEVSEENEHLLSVPSETHEDHVDITDGLTSKSESSAPTAIEVPQPTVRAESPNVHYSQISPHAGMIGPFTGNGRQNPSSSQAVYPHMAHQFRPVFQLPFAHQPMPAHHPLPSQTVQFPHNAVPSHYASNQAQTAHQIPSTSQGPPGHQVHPPGQPPLIDIPPPSYEKAMEMAKAMEKAKSFEAASHSSSSIGETSISRSNSKRKRSSESLGSRNESVGPRARKQLQAQASSSSAISEAPCASGVVNAGNPAQNRYRNGRAKPEPKQWNRAAQSRIAYVPVPHVSKIHREPLHNETSV